MRSKEIEIKKEINDLLEIARRDDANTEQLMKDCFNRGVAYAMKLIKPYDPN